MKKKKIYRNYINTAINLNRTELLAVLNGSKVGIDPELLFSIIVIEKMNRGHLSNYLFENIISILLPSIITKTNASIGLCQIRVSAASKVSNLSDMILVKKLMNPTYNIYTMAKLIKLYNNSVGKDKCPIKIILNLHITGKKDVAPNMYLNMYYDLVKWSMKMKLFYKLM